MIGGEEEFMEARSEQGIMSSRDLFTASLQKQPAQSHQQMPAGMRLAYAPDGMAVYKPVSSTSSPSSLPFRTGAASAGGGVGGGGDGAVPAGGHGLTINMGSDPVKRKRGRPRKYGPDGSMNLALAGSAVFSPSSVGGAETSAAAASLSAPDGTKRRGRPPGSGKKHHRAALGSVGVGFTPHIITVKPGEDVSAKIMSFSQHSPRALCILSANGAVSNVTLRQAATSGGTVTYEGRFEILSLSGSYLLSESDGHRSRTGGLSISLAGPDGRVLGGGVAGLLTAASPVQMVVGTFVADGKKEPKKASAADFTAAPRMLAAAPQGNSSPSRGTFSESSGGAGSPINHSTGIIHSAGGGAGCDDSNQLGLSSMAWK